MITRACGKYRDAKKPRGWTTFHAVCQEPATSMSDNALLCMDGSLVKIRKYIRKGTARKRKHYFPAYAVLPSRHPTLADLVRQKKMKKK